MDSLASVEVPALGYGIRYEFGIFDQVIRDCWQCEVTDKWLKNGKPVEEICAPRRSRMTREIWRAHLELACTDEEGRLSSCAGSPQDTEVRGVAYDTPIAGYRVGTCNTLRLWKAEAVESFDFEAFNHGDYDRAVEDKVASETITKVLYPNDEAQRGKVLRLQQQFFFSSCSLQDMLRIHALLGGTPVTVHEKWAVQLNDTHPAVAVAELMRLLVDEHALGWGVAWAVTRATFAYTNHTLLPEALEKWTVDLIGSLLPRHLEIVFEINRRFLDEVRAAFPGDDARLARLSLIDESGSRYVRMAHHARVGSHTITGEAQLHTDLLKQTVLRDFAEIWPEKFCNVTNGVTLRGASLRWSNPGLYATRQRGATHRRRRLAARPLANTGCPRARTARRRSGKFQQQWREVKLANKRRLATLIAERTGVTVAPDSLFDVLVKRIHEYKRQHLAVLHILTLSLRLRRDPQADVPARTFIFGG